MTISSTFAQAPGWGVVNLWSLSAQDRWALAHTQNSELNSKAHLCELRHAPVGFSFGERGRASPAQG